MGAIVPVSTSSLRKKILLVEECQGIISAYAQRLVVLAALGIRTCFLSQVSVHSLNLAGLAQ
jgi:hypothetical protein